MLTPSELAPRAQLGCSVRAVPTVSVGLVSVNRIPLAREECSRLTSLRVLHATRRRCELVRRIAEATKSSDHDLEVNDSIPYT